MLLQMPNLESFLFAIPTNSKIFSQYSLLAFPYFLQFCFIFPFLRNSYLLFIGRICLFLQVFISLVIISSNQLKNPLLIQQLIFLILKSYFFNALNFLTYNNQKIPDTNSMFSIPCASSFAPVYFNWVFVDSSFYSAVQNQNFEQSQSKNIFSPILLASTNNLDSKVTEELTLENKTEKNPSLIEKCQTQDEEYTPGNCGSKKIKKNQQNQNRNIIPNIVNQILSYIQKKNKSLGMTEKIFEKYNIKSEWSVKRFYLYQAMLKNKISHYVNQQTMRIFLKTDNVDSLVYSIEQQQFYNKISRILVFHFLNTEAETSTLTSKRMDKSKKALHIRVIRELSQKLDQIYKVI